MRGIAIVGLVAGCYTSAAAPTPPLVNRAEPATAPGRLAITRTSVGPISAHTRATLVELRRVLAGYEVKPSNVEGGLEYDVHDGGEKLMFVVPNDDGSVFNVHVVSPTIEVVGKSWRVGKAFQGAAALTECECWGEHLTCFTQGEHVAVNFARDCAELEGKDRQLFGVLDGLAIQRIIWSPHPFGVERPVGGDGFDEDDDDPADPCAP
jgi:hypothetical protein